MKKPLVGLAAIHALGILSGDRIPVSFALLYPLAAALILIGLLCVKKQLVFNVILSLFIFTLGALSIKNSRHLSKCHISKIIRYQCDEPYIVKGMIANRPLPKNNKISFILKAQIIKSGGISFSCDGNILVSLSSRQNFSYGEEIILAGKLRRPFGGFGRLGRSYRQYLADQDIWFLMNVKTEADLIRLNKNSGFILKRLALWLEGKMEEALFRYAAPLTAGILDAMILGEKKYVPGFVNNAMMKSGTVHILVVSGFNVGIVTFIILLFLKFLRLPRNLRYAATIPCLILYCLMTGASNPVVRATIMAVVFLLSALIKREPDIYNSCALAFLSILLFNPRQLFDVGFQLSFVCVASLIFLYPKIKASLKIRSLPRKCFRFLLDGFLVSLSCWLATAGFIAYYFKMFSPITVAANVIIVPLATLMTLCGFSLIFIGFLCPNLAPYFANTCDVLAVILVKLNAFLIKLPAACLLLS